MSHNSKLSNEGKTMIKLPLIQTDKRNPDDTPNQMESWKSLFNNIKNNTENFASPKLESIDLHDDTLDEFDEFFPKQNKSMITTKEHDCLSCGGKLFISNTIIFCKDCGEEVQKTSNMAEEDYSTSASTDCNVNSNGFISIKITGKGSYNYHKSLLKTCANYSKYRKLNTMKDISKWNSESKKIHIPKNVLQEANEMFAIIKDHGYVFRKDHKNGVISNCIYYRCYANGITKTPSEIAQFTKIEEKFHSFGDRILHELHERGIINIPMKINPIADYVERYLELLNIPKKYKPFVVELIERAERKHIHVLHDSKNSTKAIGAIYMLIQRIPELKQEVTKEKIDAEISISKTTFIRYYEILCKYYKKIKKIFKKHGIPMPNKWRDNEKKKKLKDNYDEMKKCNKKSVMHKSTIKEVMHQETAHIKSVAHKEKIIK